MYQIPEANRRLLEAMKRLRAEQKSAVPGNQTRRDAAPSRPKGKSGTPATRHSDIPEKRREATPSRPPQEPSVRTKQQEFPGIDWDDTMSGDIQLAQLLYNERVRTFGKMRQMLDSVADGQQIAEDFGRQFARLDDSNRQAQAELEHYNAEKTFLYIHPIAKKFKK